MFKRRLASETVAVFVEPLSTSSGKLLLRVTVAGLMLFHGIDKLQNGIGGIEKMVTGANMPSWIAYGVYVGELIAPTLILVGLWTRPAALIFAFNMVVALFLAHRGDFTRLGSHGEWAVESPMFYLLTAICIILLGPGRFCLGRKTGPLA